MAKCSKAKKKIVKKVMIKKAFSIGGLLTGIGEASQKAKNYIGHTYNRLTGKYKLNDVFPERRFPLEPETIQGQAARIAPKEKAFQSDFNANYRSNSNPFGVNPGTENTANPFGTQPINGGKPLSASGSTAESSIPGGTSASRTTNGGANVNTNAGAGTGPGAGAGNGTSAGGSTSTGNNTNSANKTNGSNTGGTNTGGTNTGGTNTGGTNTGGTNTGGTNTGGTNTGGTNTGGTNTGGANAGGSTNRSNGTNGGGANAAHGASGAEQAFDYAKYDAKFHGFDPKAIKAKNFQDLTPDELEFRLQMAENYAKDKNLISKTVSTLYNDLGELSSKRIAETFGVDVSELPEFLQNLSPTTAPQKVLGYIRSSNPALYEKMMMNANTIGGVGLAGMALKFILNPANAKKWHMFRGNYGKAYMSYLKEDPAMALGVPAAGLYLTNRSKD